MEKIDPTIWFATISKSYGTILVNTVYGFR